MCWIIRPHKVSTKYDSITFISFVQNKSLMMKGWFGEDIFWTPQTVAPQKQHFPDLWPSLIKILYTMVELDHFWTHLMYYILSNLSLGMKYSALKMVGLERTFWTQFPIIFVRASCSCMVNEKPKVFDRCYL